MKNTPYYLLIFNHIVHQIYTGHIEVGEYLPSVKSMSQRYAVSENSVKSAIKLLSDSGFVKTHSGKRTIVISNSGNLAFSSEWISEQMKTLSNLYQLFYMIFPPIAVLSVRNFKENDFEDLEKIVAGLENTVENYFEFRKYKLYFVDKLVSQSGNSFMKIFCHMIKESAILPGMASDMESLIESILIPDHVVYCSKAKLICSLAKTNQLEEMCQKLRELYLWVQERILLSMSKLLTEHPSPSSSVTYSIPSMYDDYLYDVIVADIIGKIGSGQYKEKDFLPPVQTVIKEYQISLPTARKAYQKLNEYGIAKTTNGIGTQIILFSEYPSSYVETPEGMYRLRRFWEAFQFITVTLPCVLPYMGEKIEADKIANLENRLMTLWSHYSQWEDCFPFAFLDDLVQSSKDDNLIKLISYLKKDIIFGIYIERFYRKHSNSHAKNYLTECAKSLEYLKQTEIELFSQTFSAIFLELFGHIEKIYDTFGWHFEKIA